MEKNRMLNIQADDNKSKSAEASVKTEDDGEFDFETFRSDRTDPICTFDRAFCRNRMINYGKR